MLAFWLHIDSSQLTHRAFLNCDLFSKAPVVFFTANIFTINTAKYKNVNVQIVKFC